MKNRFREKTIHKNKNGAAVMLLRCSLFQDFLAEEKWSLKITKE